MASKDLTIRLLGDLSDLQKKLNQASNDLSKVGATMSKTVTPAAAATAVALTKLGNDWNDASDAIIVGTGASGDALDGLLNSAKRVAGQVPNDFGEVGAAIAEVNTRLGLTGPELEDTSKAFLDLSRITGTDVKTNIGLVTRVFGDWSVASEDQAGALDTLFAATQQTGIGIDRLSSLVVQFGAPMRQLGFSMEESIAIFGKFEKEGVNIEAVMSGLRMGLGRMAKAGEEPIETFQRLVDEIKNAGSQGEANALALEGFGQRAGPDMAAAIREGRFEIADLVAALGNTDGALSDAADRTIHLDDRLKMLKNQVTAAIGPFGEVGGAIAGAAAAAGPLLFGLGQMGPALVKVTQKMGGLKGSLTKVGGALGVAGVAFAAYQISAQKAAEHTRKASEAAQELSRTTDELVGQTLANFLFEAAFAGESLDDTMSDLARTNIEGAKRALEVGKAQGLSADMTKALEDAIKREEAAREQQAKTTEDYTDAAEDATDATDEQSRSVSALNQWVDKARYLSEQYEKQTDRQTAAQEEATAAAKEATEAQRRQQEQIQELIGKKAELVGGDIAVREAQRRATEAMAELTEGATAQSEEVDKATQAQLDAAGAAAEYRIEQMEASGETVNARQKAQILADELGKLAAGLDGPVLAALMRYIDELNSIPRNINSRITFSVSGAKVTAGGDFIGSPNDFGGRRAAGGPVAAGSLYEVGERGKPELFEQNGRQYLIPGNNGQVTPAADGGGGIGGGNTFVYSPMFDGGEASYQQFMRYVEEHEKRKRGAA